MDQPLLSEIEPYVNRNLFSDHFLRELLPDNESWAVDEDKVRLAMQATLNLYAPRKEELPDLNEAQLEQEFVRPLLESLGHVFQVQPSLPTSEGVRRPDYAFFATREDKRQARKDRGKLDYFKKAIAIGDAKPWGQPLDKRQRRGTDKFDMLSPSWQIDYYLRTSEVPWAILTDGRLWRLYNRETSFRLDVYYEIDLPQILATRDIEAFKYFSLFFRREAFIRDPEGLCFLDRVYQGSLEYAREVGDDLKESVYKALRILAEGFVQTPGNNLDPGRDLETIHASALIYLYRLLFINYAEDRRLLPRDKRLYKETYGLVSMEGEIASKLERQESLSPLQATYWEKLRVLFDLINRGSEAFGIDKDTLFVPPYNGGLFDPQRHPLLEENKVADRWLAQVMDLLARSKGEGPGRAFVDYSSLDVRHLGSIYEGLLEYKLRVAEEPMVAIKTRGKENWVPAKEAEGKKLVDRAQVGDLHLVTDRGERKATGSFYTPDYIVKYIVENTVGPLVEEKMKEEDPIEAILSLKVLDPAMGSGHFLVEATDRLAHALVQALGGSQEEPEEDDIRWARREVVERCIYGVDLNPLAVELAKLSLWLHTVAEGKPLNFLDHHLKVGNSLIGAWVEDLGSLPTKRKRVRLSDSEEVSARQMNLLEQRLNEKLPVMLGKVLEISERPTETLEDIKGKEAADQAMTELKAPFKAVADLCVSTYFGNEVTEGEYQEALEYVGEPKQLLTLPATQRAAEIAEEKRFFHWELEFPEVFYEDSKRQESPGFDAAVGNPPYVNMDSVPHDLSGYLKLAAPSVWMGQSDIYYFFLTRGTALLRGGGQLGYITSRYYLEAWFARGLRQTLADAGDIVLLVDFGNCEVFAGVGIDCALLVLRRHGGLARKPTPARVMRLEDPDCSPKSVVEREHVARLFELTQSYFSSAPWTIVPPVERQIMRKMSAQTPLAHLAVIGMGMQTGANDVFSIPQSKISEFELVESECRPVISNSDIGRYYIDFRDKYWLYLENASEGQVKSRSRLHSYLLRHYPRLIQRIAYRRGDCAWFRYSYPRYVKEYPRPKLLVPYLASQNRFGVDAKGAFLSSTDTFIVVPHDEQLLLYLAAVLNSTLLTWIYRRLGKLKGGGLYSYSRDGMGRLPIRSVSFTSPRKQRSALIIEGEGLMATHLEQTAARQDYGSLLESELGKWIQARLVAKPEQSDVIHDLLAHLAEQMIGMNKERQAEAKGFLDWLAGYIGLPIEDWRLKTTVKAYWKHGWDEMRRALRQNRKPIEKASGRNVEGREALETIQSEFDQSVAQLKPLLERIAATDRLIDLIVYRLYDLTEEEVAIVEGE